MDSLFKGTRGPQDAEIVIVGEANARRVELTKGYVAYVSGIDFERVDKHLWYADVGQWGVYAKCDNVDGKRVRLHQFILGENGVDHLDGNGLNNTRSNLKKKTQSENNHNGKFQRNGTSGIWFNLKRSRYEVTVTVNYKKHYIGVTKTFEEAQRIRGLARKRLLGEENV